MLLTDFDYDLPEELIAQTPCEKRDHSRLMVLDRHDGAVQHEYFFDVKKYLRPGDTLVFNNTRVIPARLIGHRDETGGKVEVFLLRRTEGNKWEVLVKPGKKAKIGDVIKFGAELTCRILEHTDFGGRVVEFFYDGIWEEILDRLGQTPLPPYIHEKLADKERYQTVYAKENGSAAAPTAGLHFTKKLMGEIKDMGVNLEFITLHVGLGTFRPVNEENIEDHVMHTEYFHIDKDTAERINAARKLGGRIIAVGTTSIRTLESAASADGILPAKSGETGIFIYPGYKFKIVDGIITNFHLPKSTLIMLISAFAGREFTLRAYNVAVQKRYRFFSFGDAMLIL
ncbi:tRNA preQ1(34) S-adenosylmethionine ribosyltransferase-isomerase QueA [Pectinatus frisingensis]|jgi:S-adenosylmethionine:tRNA ribosyltransferase-isomerase|uniref:tRNA preQ1(34) S-adenosylmethionine ribosyltransferase-isomerase QueA n=1 Tax=Pectinatus frisingensis TaxID=865 RepID=UPI0015F745AE|nr:tRNA preQ1(34) S-adenosylmethionine ribosyltransferase-isomerase QueA [Pectinatus frisingensis]